MIDRILKGFLSGLTFLPYEAQAKIGVIIIRILLFLRPSYRRIAHINLSIAFPNASDDWKEEVLKKHIIHLGYVFADSLRLPSITSEWVEKHVTIDMANRLRYLSANNVPIIAVSGHLGSFEWMPSLLAHYGLPIHYIVRSLKQPKVDAWWNARRESHGSKVVPRNRGMRGIMQALKAHKSIGLLFDQNVRRNNAIFVPWFSRRAATTRALALSVNRYKCPVLVGGLFRTGDQEYLFEITELNFRGMIESGKYSSDHLEQYITRRCVEVFEEYIAKAPEQWFWFHRRWKTSPHEDIPEDVYSSV